MHYDLVRTIDAAVEPVSLDEAKAHCRVDIDDDDDLLTGLITAARQYAEKYTGRAFLSQTWRLSLERFPYIGYRRGTEIAQPGESRWYGVPRWRLPQILLPRPNLIAVASITYLDTNNELQTLDPETYNVDADAQPARLTPVYGQQWPFVCEQPGCVKVTYTAGYGAGAASVPHTLKLAILMLAAHWYENREATILPVSGTGVVSVPIGVAELLDIESVNDFTFES